MKAKAFSKADRKKVAAASDGLPDLGTWLKRIAAIGNPELTAAIDGIWCGRSGESRMDVDGYKSMLCVGWYNGRVEWSYLS